MKTKIIEIIGEIAFLGGSIAAAVFNFAAGSFGFGILWALLAVLCFLMIITMCSTAHMVPESRLSQKKYKWNIACYALGAFIFAWALAMSIIYCYPILYPIYCGLLCSGDLLYCLSNYLEMKKQ